MATTFNYAGQPSSVVALTARSPGVELTVTEFTVQGRTAARCVMDLDEFRELLADAAAVLTDAEIARYCDGSDHD